MVKKHKFYCIGNKGKFNYYLFEKNQDSVEKLIEIFDKILRVEFYLYDVCQTKGGKQSNKKINFDEIQDEHIYSDSHDESSTRVDIFYGAKKIFVTILCSQKLRIKFNEAIDEFFVMSEYKSPKNVGRTKDKNTVLGDFEHNKNFLKKSKSKK